MSKNSASEIRQGLEYSPIEYSQYKKVPRSLVSDIPAGQENR